MAIVHIVLFQFKSTADTAAILEACDRMLSLKSKCVLSDQKTYIMESSGGKDNSPEGLQDGLTHAFVTIFANESDRKFYLDEDPVHDAFKKYVKDVVEKVVVIDYEPQNF